MKKTFLFTIFLGFAKLLVAQLQTDGCYQRGDLNSHQNYKFNKDKTFEYGAGGEVPGSARKGHGKYTLRGDSLLILQYSSPPDDICQDGLTIGDPTSKNLNGSTGIKMTIALNQFYLEHIRKVLKKQKCKVQFLNSKGALVKEVPFFDIGKSGQIIVNETFAKDSFPTSMRLMGKKQLGGCRLAFAPNKIKNVSVTIGLCSLGGDYRIIYDVTMKRRYKNKGNGQIEIDGALLTYSPGCLKIK